MGPEPLPLHLTPQAQADLEAIWLYTFDRWGPMQADRYLDGLSDAFDMLCAMPTLAREYPDFTPPVRIHPTGSHLVVYVAAADHLAVIRVLGGQQDWKSILDRIDG
ncbi:MAG: type II toxin-antitoxin system RelE/ParE family toxin [Sphingomonadales bacterium]|nr:MAG: type II toxin-antitoxin system RelE/ParE family toxin [Sphingomonadales bacterium]